MGPEFDHEEVDLITAMAMAIVAGRSGPVASPAEVFDVAEELVRERKQRYSQQLKGCV